jgi:hypothetical protein
LTQRGAFLGVNGKIFSPAGLFLPLNFQRAFSIIFKKLSNFSTVRDRRKKLRANPYPIGMKKSNGDVISGPARPSLVAEIDILPVSVAIEKRSKTAQNRDCSDRAAKPEP